MHAVSHLTAVSMKTNSITRIKRVIPTRKPMINRPIVEEIKTISNGVSGFPGMPVFSNDKFDVPNVLGVVVEGKCVVAGNCPVVEKCVAVGNHPVVEKCVVVG